jgi:hypothetical protein
MNWCDWFSEWLWFVWCGTDRPISIIGSTASGSAGIPVSPISPVIPNAVSVPEPTTWLLILVGLSVILIGYYFRLIMDGRKLRRKQERALATDKEFDQWLTGGPYKWEEIHKRRG